MHPLPYLISYTCFGTRLHDNFVGSNKITGLIRRNHGQKNHERRLVKQGGYSLDNRKAAIALSAIRETAAQRNWNLLACHMDQTHVHVVVIADQKPERVMGDLKSSSSRALTKAGCVCQSGKRWASGGGKQNLRNYYYLLQSIGYTIDKHDKPLASYENPELHKILDTFSKQYISSLEVLF